MVNGQSRGGKLRGREFLRVGRRLTEVCLGSASNDRDRTRCLDYGRPGHAPPQTGSSGSARRCASQSASDRTAHSATTSTQQETDPRPLANLHRERGGGRHLSTTRGDQRAGPRRRWVGFRCRPCRSAARPARISRIRDPRASPRGAAHMGPGSTSLSRTPPPRGGTRRQRRGVVVLSPTPSHAQTSGACAAGRWT